MSQNKLFLLLILIVAGGVLIGHLFFHKPASAPTMTQTAPNTIEIKNYAYAPQTITVKVGTTVTWKNTDLVPHTVTKEDPASEGPDSELFGKDKEYSYTFTKPGTYNYYCKPHPYMKAAVVVTE